MKKQKRSRIGSLLRRIFDFRYWVDADRLKGFTQYFIAAFKRLFILEKKTRQSSAVSFETAVKAMKLSEADIQGRLRALKRLSALMAVMSLAVFIYSCYHLFWGTWPGFYLSMVVSMLAATLAFRYHFWFFQIKTRKLGCTFSEWFRQGLMGDK